MSKQTVSWQPYEMLHHLHVLKRFISPADKNQMNDFLQNYQHSMDVYLFLFLLILHILHYSNPDKPRMSVPTYETT